MRCSELRTNNPITLWHGLPSKAHCKCDVQSSGRTILSNFGMGAEPLLPEVKAQDGNSIGNSILKKRKKESKSLLINIELPIELPPWCLASARRCFMGTAMPGVSPARVWPWPRPMPGSSLFRAWPRLRPGAQDQAHAQRCPSSARASLAAECFLVRTPGVRSAQKIVICVFELSFKS